MAFSQLRISVAVLNVDRVSPGDVLDTQSRPIPRVAKNVVVTSGQSCKLGSSYRPCIGILDGPNISFLFFPKYSSFDITRIRQSTIDSPHKWWHNHPPWFLTSTTWTEIGLHPPLSWHTRPCRICDAGRPDKEASSLRWKSTWSRSVSPKSDQSTNLICLWLGAPPEFMPNNSKQVKKSLYTVKLTRDPMSVASMRNRPWFRNFHFCCRLCCDNHSSG
jgi:hypothetical protein